MKLIQLSIPPLPQFITIGHAVWAKGEQHLERCFNVFDMLLVMKGELYMKEDDQLYTISKNKMLVLEPGHTHVGFKPCEEETEIYWIHFYHPLPTSRIEYNEISWSTPLPVGTDQDRVPSKQRMFIPKWATIDPAPFLPILEEMLIVQNKLNEGNALLLQSLMIQLFTHIQNWLQHGVQGETSISRSLMLSHQIEDYLRRNIGKPFQLKQLEKEFHFNTEYLSRCLKKHTGKTPLQYLQFLRIEEAKKMLIYTDESISQICVNLGVDNYNYFIRLFRTQVGMTPGQYRKVNSGFL
ncbi:helix-turn-helix domain-containing protein [Bacillus niameyensis]|uniref:helix-turn-helix domain-containing protein n=1 Tax=Bacillus niameyensis TaxID=1522308 RepID=UPI00078384FF|nr:AraC family transcriptional regulator [Bacillus niameyensis]